ncbi:hypothetical protein COB11_08400 [Candidatus Aerophobetes bacterium]|uniref:Uncharacterized protein n=1 Tax=Aerophobetes bacterium TaxID=2030807 RepID=A0A2A4Y8T2_UNCAE|nr:MAG: hypothetical protein COB11_08590 [Candidatus Aerophobetes bacterium]PCI91447.1 MAG: hypothetical protein COB11_08400 [Candidatus Aerophobetes bacterium]
MLYPETKESLDRLPQYLQLYVFLLLDMYYRPSEVSQLNRYLEDVRIKTIQNFPTNLLSLTQESFFRQIRVEFDVDFKFKGIRYPKDELPPELNFRAREALPPEGFEAGEVLFSTIPVHPHWNVFAKLGLYEQWVSEFISYEKIHGIENTLSSMEDFENRFKGTMKYGMGLKWMHETKAKRKLSLEAMLEQKSHNEWILRESLLSHKGYSGILFDNWKFTFTFDF